MRRTLARPAAATGLPRDSGGPRGPESSPAFRAGFFRGPVAATSLGTPPPAGGDRLRRTPRPAAARPRARGRRLPVRPPPDITRGGRAPGEVAHPPRAQAQRGEALVL